MPSLKHLRRRIRTVINTQQITSAMQSVSASKMRRTQDRRDKIQPYAERLQRLVAHVIGSVGTEGQPLMQIKEPEKRLLVVFSSDRGLCGAFNNTIIRYAEDYAKSLTCEYQIYTIGKKVSSYLNKRGYPIHRTQVDFRGNIALDRIQEIAGDLKDTFIQGEFSHIELLYNRAITAMTYRPHREQFLPLREEDLMTASQEDQAPHEAVEYIFEPDAKTLLSTLLPKYVETKIYYVFVDAFVAEHQARMLAMRTANDNCEELIDTLTLQMNKARQADITKELLDIVGGAEALQG